MNLDRSSDNELLARFDAGDRNALTQLMTKYSDVVSNTARRAIDATKVSVEVDDILQDLFILLMAALEKFDRTRSLKPWLTTITKRIVYRYARERSAKLADDEWLEQVVITNTADLPSVEARKNELVKAVRELTQSKDQRLNETEKALIQFKLDEAPHSVVADALGISRAAVGMKYLRLKAKLSQIVGNGKYLSTVLSLNNVKD